MVLQAFQCALIIGVTESIYLAAVHPILPFPSTFTNIVHFSREISLHIMYLKYDNLNLIIVLSRNSELICLMNYLFFLAIHDSLKNLQQ